MNLLLSASLVIASWAQGPPAPVKSPEVHADKRVTFRISAPAAKEVALQREGGGRKAMEKNEQGLWSITTEPLEPDYYGYSFVVDGLTTPDRSNPLVKPSLISAPGSMVHVPGSPPLAWDPAPVPHGSLHYHAYRSGVIGADTNFYVYTPPGYEASSRRYPVLYLLHGITDDASGWTKVGRAHNILDNLIAQGKAEPMIMVNTLGYGVPNPDSFARMADPASMKGFSRAVVEEVIPMVERMYRANADRDSRAIAGLSMGGAQTLQIGLNHLNRFAWLASFSGAFVLYNPPGTPRGQLDAKAFEAAFTSLDAKVAASLRMLWIACGVDDGLLGGNRQLKDWLQAKSIPVRYTESPGAHTWMVWRRNLTELAPMLFRKTGGAK